eukprot:scaffold21571_cov120-Isochrysis_galbana.AAC.5
MIGRAPGVTVKGGGGKGGNASLPGDSRVSRRIRPLALLILKKNFLRVVALRVCLEGLRPLHSGAVSRLTLAGGCWAFPP